MDDELTPTEYLILEVLAARLRCGEPRWPFPNRLRPTLRRLAGRKLIGFQPFTVAGHQVAWLTIDGEHRALDLSYVPASTATTR